LKKYSVLIAAFCTAFVFITGCENIRATQHFENGKRFAKDKQYAMAAEEFELAVQANPRHDQAFEALGLIYGTMSMLEKSAHCFERALALKPEDKLYLQNLAVTYMKLEKFTEAMELYIRILAVNKENEVAKKQIQAIENIGY
jgi:tetratricopeptide (TPR) repeat protein